MSIKPLQSAPAAHRRQRICVIFPGALGDFVCFLPALETLLRDAHVDLFARSEYADLVPGGVTLRSLESAEITNLFVHDSQRAPAVQSYFGIFDAVYSWLGSDHRGFIDRLQSFSHRRAKLFPFRPTVSVDHQADYYLRCLDAPASSGCKRVIQSSAEASAWGERFWTENSLHHKAVLTVAPGSGAREKNWPEEYFLETVRWWRSHTRGAAVLLLGPVEQERGGVDRLRADCLVADELRLSQAVAVLDRSTLFLGNDSGITQLAAAVGVATVALFGPSDPHCWAPRGKRVTLVRRQMNCAPCSNDTMKSCPHRACLRELYPAELIEILIQLPELSNLTR